MAQAVRIVAAVGGFLLILVSAEIGARRLRWAPEEARKFAHVASGLLAATLPFWLPWWAVFSIAGAFVPFLALARRWRLFPALQSVERNTWGEVWFPLGVFLTALLVRDADAFAYGVSVLAVGDAAAADFGQRWGRRRHLHARTYVGSAALVVVTAGLTPIWFTASGVTGVALLTWPLAIGIAVAVGEAVSPTGTDNVVVPVLAAVLYAMAV